MESRIDLYNLSLSWLGGEQLEKTESALSSSAVGRLCENNFPHVLDYCLSVHNWSFATKNVILAQKLQQDLEINNKFPYKYGKPADCLKIVRLTGAADDGLTVNYVVEGNDILTKVNPAKLIYVARITEPRSWPPYFCQAMSYYLSGLLSTARNNNPKVSQLCQQLFERSISAAVAFDHSNQRPEPSESQWINARWENSI